MTCPAAFRFTVLLLAGLIAAAAAARAHADLIKLKDGRTLDGRIVSETDDEIKVEMARGSMTIPRKDVVEIVRQKSNVEILGERLHALTPADPARYLETGKWCLQEIKREDLGLRMVSLAMALDPQQFYTEGQLFLGDYHLNQRNDRYRAAQFYMRALLADPNNPACAERFEQVKDSVQQVLKDDDRNLLRGIEHVRDLKFEEAIEAFATGRRSGLRPRVEEILGRTVADVVAYCESQIPCKTCKGSHHVTCPECKGPGAKDCKSCGGDGVRKRMSSKGTEEIPCKECDGWGNILCKRCKARRMHSTAVRPDARMNKSIDGGKITCVTCKGKDPAKRPEPAPDKVQDCWTFLDRRLSGTMTAYEQTETRMVRVGGAALIEGAEELLAAPVWWEDRWISAEERATVDPGYKAKVGTEEEEFSAIRKSATPLQGDAAAASRTLEQVRQLFGVGAVSPSVAQQVYVTEFVNQSPDGDQKSSGSFVEIDVAGSLLRPCLVQSGQEFSTLRAVLTGGSGTGIPTGRVPDLAGFASSPASRVRIYYSVADSKEDILPQADRDIGVHQLIAKVRLIDFVDATGRIVKSTR